MKEKFHEGKKQNLSKALVRFELVFFCLFVCFSGGYITTVSGFDFSSKNT